MAKSAPKYDYTEVGQARREAIQALDQYGCTVAEQCAMFGHGKQKSISPATFHRFALDVRLLRRPGKPYAPGCRSDRNDPNYLPNIEPAMPASDSLEIAVVALLRSRKEFSPGEIIEALGASKSTVYRLRGVWRSRRGAPSEAEVRWHQRHIPSHAYLNPLHMAGYHDRIARRWVSRRGRTAG